MMSLRYHTIALFIAFLVSTFQAEVAAQESELKLGWNIGFVNLDPMNDIIDRYNQTRPWLDEEMQHINFIHGPLFGFSVVNDEWAFGASWMGKRKVVTANGTQANGQFGERFLRVRYNSLSGHFERYFGYSFGLGATIDVANFKVHSKVEVENERSDWTRYARINTFGTHLYAVIKGPLLELRPYINFPLVSFPSDGFNLAALEEALDPVNPLQGNSAYYDFRPRNFGLMLVFRVAVD